MTDLDTLKLRSTQHSKLLFIEDLLKDYNLIKPDSKKVQTNLLSFTHFDLELDKELSYKKRVSLWLDFVTTVYVIFNREPILLTEAGGIPSLKHLIGNLFYEGTLPDEQSDLVKVPEVTLI